MENHTTALDSSYNHSRNISYPVYEIYDYGDHSDGINTDIVCWFDSNDRGDLLSKIVIGIFFPMSLLSIYSLHAQIRSERVVPVFIINLLISDVLQVVCMAVNLAYDMDHRIKWTYFLLTYHVCVVASVFFMTFIALERYLMIAQPLWYRFSKTTKVFVSVSIVTWIFSIIMRIVIVDIEPIVLLPLPLMMYFVVGTFRALSTAQAVPAAEKRRIVAVLVVVVLIYIVMFLPMVLGISIYIYSDHFYNYGLYINFMNFSCMLIQISPLTDIFLYIFLKKWFIDKLLTSLCCCIKDSDEAQQIVDETGSSTSKSKDHECP